MGTVCLEPESQPGSLETRLGSLPNAEAPESPGDCDTQRGLKATGPESCAVIGQNMHFVQGALLIVMRKQAVMFLSQEAGFFYFLVPRMVHVTETCTTD